MEMKKIENAKKNGETVQKSLKFRETEEISVRYKNRNHFKSNSIKIAFRNITKLY